MKTSFKAYAGFAVLFFTFLVSACGKRGKNTESSGAKNELIPVEILNVRSENISQKVVFTSTLHAWAMQNIAPQSAGRIEKIHALEGQRVKQGQVLVQMNDSQLRQLQIQLTSAEKDYKRMQNLYEQGAIALQQLEIAKDQYLNILNNFDLTKSNTGIKAPFNGIVTARTMNEGEIFTMSPTAAGAPSILVLQQLDVLKANLSVSEKYFPQVKVGQKAEVQSDVYPDKVFEGVISNVFPTIDAATRTFTVEVKIQNTEELLRPGMFSRITLYLGENTGVMVPRSAIVRQPGTENFYGYIVQNDTARKIKISTGAGFDEWVEVYSGIKEGDVLVTTGQGRLKEGSAVKVVSQFREETANE
ncbi:MAG: efflux RND transporter periplasmic adaptor subunit [Cytophagaceae bacterium]